MSRHLMLTLCVTLLLSSHVALYGEEIAPPMRQVMFKARVCEGDPKGSLEAKTMKVLAEPTLVTLLRRPASFSSGGERGIASLLRKPECGNHNPVPIGNEQSRFANTTLGDYLVNGTTMEFIVDEICGDEVKAAVFLEISYPADTGSEYMLATSGQCFRQKGFFPIGKATRMTTKPDANGRTTWVDFTIELVEPATPAGK